MGRRISEKKRAELAAQAAEHEPVFPTWEAALERLKADGAEYVSEYNAGRGYTFFRKSARVPGGYASAVLFKLHETDARGAWQRGAWLFSHDGLYPSAVPVPFARPTPEGATP